MTLLSASYSSSENKIIGQWGRIGDSTSVPFPIDFSSTNYSALAIHWGTAVDAPTAIRVDLNTKSAFVYCIKQSVSAYAVWIAIGY